MPSQLRLVQAPPPDDPAPVAVFRADARLRLWGAAVCALVAIFFTIAGDAHRVPPVLAGPLAAAFLLWAAWLAATFALRRTTRYTLSTQRIEVEKGILGKRYESVELWRVRDVVLEQTFFERLRGVGRITVYSSDQEGPILQLGPAAEARSLFDRLRDAVAAARKDAQVVPIRQ
jgi:membrane protein YdbS with pleckstrin-like domain